MFCLLVLLLVSFAVEALNVYPLQAKVIQPTTLLYDFPLILVYYYADTIGAVLISCVCGEVSGIYESYSWRLENFSTLWASSIPENYGTMFAKPICSIWHLP